MKFTVPQPQRQHAYRKPFFPALQKNAGRPFFQGLQRGLMFAKTFGKNQNMRPPCKSIGTLSKTVFVQAQFILSIAYAVHGYHFKAAQ